MASPAPAQRLSSLFQRSPIVDVGDLERALPGRSRRSLYRDLGALDYLTSYTHAGGYYTLRKLASFDEDGLWMHQGVGFSKHGTLKATCHHMVEVALAGRTHGELALPLRVRVHNTLLDLVNEGGISRQSVGPTFLYVSARRSRAAAQVQKRLESLRAQQPLAVRTASYLVIEVLLELVRSSKELAFSITGITRRLLARGVGITPEQVAEVVREHRVVKKGRHSQSRSSRR